MTTSSRRFSSLGWRISCHRRDADHFISSARTVASLGGSCCLSCTGSAGALLEMVLNDAKQRLWMALSFDLTLQLIPCSGINRSS
jgi:hypothetical protein